MPRPYTIPNRSTTGVVAENAAVRSNSSRSSSSLVCACTEIGRAIQSSGRGLLDRVGPSTWGNEMRITRSTRCYRSGRRGSQTIGYSCREEAFSGAGAKSTSCQVNDRVARRSTAACDGRRVGRDRLWTQLHIGAPATCRQAAACGDTSGATRNRALRGAETGGCRDCRPRR